MNLGLGAPQTLPRPSAQTPSTRSPHPPSPDSEFFRHVSVDPDMPPYPPSVHPLRTGHEGRRCRDSLFATRGAIAPSSPSPPRVSQTVFSSPTSARLFRQCDRLRSEEHTSELQSQSNLVCR